MAPQLNLQTSINSGPPAISVPEQRVEIQSVRTNQPVDPKKKTK